MRPVRGAPGASAAPPHPSPFQRDAPMMTDLSPSHAIAVETVLDHLGTPPEGLSTTEAARRLAAHGANALPAPPQRGVLRRLAGQFGNLLVIVLIVASGVTLLLGHPVDTAVILGVVVINALIGFIQEGRAETAMAAIRDMLSPRASVLRDGLRATVEGAAVVPGARPAGSRAMAAPAVAAAMVVS